MTSDTVTISNPDKQLYPAEEISKGDVAGYYRDVAEVMLPHLHDRPLILHPFPDGTILVRGDSAYHRHPH
jgi:bifunctional non-homologous end joining protein LigD